MTVLKRFLILAALTCSLSVAHAATEVIELNFRMADSLLPVAHSVLGNEGRATAYGKQLIVNASQEKIDELRSVLSKIDTQPRRLLISVDTRGQHNHSQQGYQAQGHVSGRHGDITFGQDGLNGRNQVRIIDNSTHNRNGSLQSVQTLEGSAALVQIGQDIPQRSTQYGQYGQIHERTEYRAVNQGFYVTATLVGDQVQIEIDQHNDRRSHQPGVINTQNTSSQVSGRLGEWISVSGAQSHGADRQNGWIQKRYSTAQENNQLQIKVDVLD